MKYSFRFASLILLSLTSLAPESAHADRTITTDTTQDGGTFVVDPAGVLRISDVTNNPLLTLTNGGSTSGIKGVLIGGGADAEGRLLVEDKSILSNSGFAAIGFGEGSIGSATVTGSVWTNGGDLNVGYFRGQGTLNIEDGGNVTSSQSSIGDGYDSKGTVTVTGANSMWDIEKKLSIGGDSGTSTLNIQDGGTVTSSSGEIGHSGNGSVTVNGVGSQWKIDDYLSISYIDDSGMLTIENGGVVTSARGYISVRDNVIAVKGSGSKWENSGTISVYSGYNGGLSIENGGLLTSSVGLVGAFSVGNVTVSGADSQWLNSGDLYIGAYRDDDGNIQSFGLSSLAVEEGGLVDVGGFLFLGARSTLDVQTGGVVKVDGTLTVDALGQYLGTLTGNGGTIKGDVINNGLIAPGNSPGVLTIDGDLTSTGIVQFELAGIGTGLFDHLIVTGELDLGGVVEIDLLGGFNPTAGNSFKLLNFGSLIDSGFTFDLSQATLATNLSWDTSTFATDGTIRVIPEASSLMLAGMATVAGLFVWRKKSR